MTAAHYGPVGRALAESGWTPADPEHPARDLDRRAKAWGSRDTALLLIVSEPRPAGHLISLLAPREPGQTAHPLWEISGGPVPAPVAVAMARAAASPTPGGPGAPLSACGWVRAAQDSLSRAIPGLVAWTGPGLGDDRAWSAVLFPMPSPELSLWTVKGAHGGHDCVLMAAADTPAHVIAAVALAAADTGDRA